MAISQTQRTELLQLLVAMFDAAPGSDVLDELANGIDAGNTIQMYAANLVNSTEFTGIYSRALTANEFATKFIGNLLGSNVTAETTAEAVAFIEARLNAGASRDTVILEAVSALQSVPETDTKYGAAVAQLSNKVEVAEYFGTQSSFTGLTLSQMQSALTGVTSDDASVTAKKAAIDSGNIDGVGSEGQTFTLTTAADNLSGTSSNDTFVAEVDDNTATVNTLGAADQLDGGKGIDTLNITVSEITGPSNLSAVTTQNIEIISIRNVDATPDALTVDGNNFAGETDFVSDRSTGAVVFNNIGTSDVTIKGNDAVNNGNVTVTAGTATTDELTINLKDGVQQGVFSANDVNSDWTSVVINSTGGTATSATNANVLTNMVLADAASDLDNVTINATTSVTTGVITGWDANGADANKGVLTVTGAGAVNVGALNASVEKVDASANTGGLTLTASSQTDFSFVGSTGNDRLTTNAVLASSGSVDAGAGDNDRLIVANSTHITSTIGAQYSNFEELQVANGVAVDLDHLSSKNTISSIRLNDGGSVTDLSATQAAAVTVFGTTGNNITVGVKGADTVGQIDTVKLTVDDGASTTSNVDIGTPVLTDIEKLELVLNDNLVVDALTAAEALDSIVITGSKTLSLTSGAITPEANTIIDGSQATGALTLDFGAIVGAATTNAMSIKGGSAADTITASGGAADLINGGAGIDSITVTKDGASSGFATVQSDALVSADADLITGFVSTENKFDFNGALSNGTGAGAGIAATEVASAATITAALATGDAANDIVFIATTDLTGAQEAALDAAVAGGMTATEADAVESALVGTAGALNGAIANLDTVLGTTDSVLFQFSTDTDTVLLRVTNSDQSATNTLTVDEIEVVGVFAATTDLVAADFV